MKRKNHSKLCLTVWLLLAGCEGARPNAQVHAAQLPSTADASSTGVGTLVVEVQGFESDQGQALIALFLTEDGFPDDPDRAFRALDRPIEDGRVALSFEAVPAGPFALAVFHDENSNFELDKNLLGIPKEPWGVSRDASGWLGPPSFDDARLQLEPQQTLHLRIPLGK